MIQLDLYGCWCSWLGVDIPGVMLVGGARDLTRGVDKDDETLVVLGTFGAWEPK